MRNTNYTKEFHTLTWTDTYMFRLVVLKNLLTMNYSKTLKPNLVGVPVTERNSYGLGYHNRQLDSRNQSSPIFSLNCYSTSSTTSKQYKHTIFHGVRSILAYIINNVKAFDIFQWKQYSFKYTLLDRKRYFY